MSVWQGLTARFIAIPRSRGCNRAVGGNSVGKAFSVLVKQPLLQQLKASSAGPPTEHVRPKLWNQMWLTRVTEEVQSKAVWKAESQNCWNFSVCFFFFFLCCDHSLTITPSQGWIWFFYPFALCLVWQCCLHETGAAEHPPQRSEDDLDEVTVEGIKSSPWPLLHWPLTSW